MPFYNNNSQTRVTSVNNQKNDQSTDRQRLEQNILCGRLWYQECDDIHDTPIQVPVSFGSIEEYVSIFEPLLLEEARESLKGAWQESQDNRKGWNVRIGSVENRGGGCFRVAIHPDDNRTEIVREKNFIVLSSCPDTPNGTGNYGQRNRREYERQRSMTPDVQYHIAGIVAMAGDREPMRVDLYPICPIHNTRADDTKMYPCMKAFEMLTKSKCRWTLTPAGSMVTHSREWDSVRMLCNSPLASVIVNPEATLKEVMGRTDVSVDNLARAWPMDDAKCLPYIKYIQSVYDMPQREAIEITASHLATDSQRAKASGQVLPITLIQGPPGTGKTHTVRGVLNTWHAVQYRRFQDQQFQHLVKQRGDSDYNQDIMDYIALQQSEDEMARRELKPRILVCAHSNAALDELLTRILTEGFKGHNGMRYYPNVVRVGSDDAKVADPVQVVWVTVLIQRYNDMPFEQWKAEVNSAEKRVRQNSAMISELRRQISRCKDEAQLAKLQGELVNQHEARSRALLDWSRLEIVTDRFRYNGTAPLNKFMRNALELSFVDNAEMVFTTLSSTGRHIFNRLSRSFDTVLIDEAAQATEVATLQALIHGAKRVVLVGDPQQLPATVISQRSRSLLLERSLFERLMQAGWPVKVLTVQYRMHPEIRLFPSFHFYNSQLTDAPSVLAAPEPAFRGHDLLKPYVVFDVSHGEEMNDRRSKSNEAEADLAAALFWELRCKMTEEMDAAIRAGREGPPSTKVGVITPYRSQVELVKRRLKYWLGQTVADEVTVETVDSFQGKQLDVIIFSSVRAQSGTRQASVGFLQDVRRLNVAITRAKQALWILTSVASLSQDPTWAALLTDAEKRESVVRNAVPHELFERFKRLWERKQAEDPQPPPRKRSSEPTFENEAGPSQRLRLPAREVNIEQFDLEPEAAPATPPLPPASSEQQNRANTPNAATVTNLPTDRSNPPFEFPSSAEATSSSSLPKFVPPFVAWAQKHAAALAQSQKGTHPADRSATTQLPGSFVSQAGSVSQQKPPLQQAGQPGLSNQQNQLLQPGIANQQIQIKQHAQQSAVLIQPNPFLLQPPQSGNSNQPGQTSAPLPSSQTYIIPSSQNPKLPSGVHLSIPAISTQMPVLLPIGHQAAVQQQQQQQQNVWILQGGQVSGSNSQISSTPLSTSQPALSQYAPPGSQPVQIESFVPSHLARTQVARPSSQASGVGVSDQTPHLTNGSAHIVKAQTARPRTQAIGSTKSNEALPLTDLPPHLLETFGPSTRTVASGISNQPPQSLNAPHRRTQDQGAGPNGQVSNLVSAHQSTSSINAPNQRANMVQPSIQLDGASLASLLDLRQKLLRQAQVP